MKKLVVIIGCAKSGTSALAQYLNRHPNVQLGTIKEPRYFTNFSEINWSGPIGANFKRSIISSHKEYLSNFPNISPSTWAVDASTDYIWCKKTPELLSKFAEKCDIRIICIVRDPVARAISEYNHTLRHNWENLSFRDSIKAESERISKNWLPLFYHTRRSLIHDDIENYSRIFGEKFLVLDYSELQDSTGLSEKLGNFLEVENAWSGKLTKENESLLPRNSLVGRALRNQSLRSLIRPLTSRKLREQAWKVLHKKSHQLKTVSETEADEFRRYLDDEIQMCLGNSLIPTDNWQVLN